MTSLSDFIKNLSDYIYSEDKKYEELFKHIKSPTNLLSSLRDLNNHIGNDGIKTKITNQTIHLIKRNKRIADGEEIKSKNMLNVCLYGGPGIGKTTIAKIIGRIMLSVGSIKNKTTHTQELKKRVKDPDRWFQLYILFIIALFIIPMFADPVWIFVVVLILLIIAFIILYTDNTVDRAETLEDTPEGSVILASKSDLVGQYLGQSQPKTRALLEKARGGVLIIDEAYEIVTEGRDLFGHEVLTELNLFMSENADEIAIIMCGYKDQMQERLFTTQPGLERRFMHHFDCEEYSGEDLVKIFELQLKNEGYSIVREDRDEIVDLFDSNYLKNQGGDTEKLSYLVVMEKTGGLDSEPDKFITYDDVYAALPSLHISKDKSNGKGDRGEDTRAIEEMIKKLMKK